jgi:hypothetical protein
MTTTDEQAMMMRAEELADLAAKCGIEYGTNTDSPTDAAGIYAYLTMERAKGGQDGAAACIGVPMPSQPREGEKVAAMAENGMRPTLDDARQIIQAWDHHPEQAPGWYSELFGERGPAEAPDTIRAAAGVPNALMGAMDSYNPPEDVAAYAFELSGNAPRGAWLVGSDYATMGATWVAGMEHGSRYVDVPELLADFEAMSRFGPEGARNRANAMRGPSVLVLNAIDGAQWTRQSVALVAPVIRYRRMASLPTVVTATTRVSGVASYLMRTISGDDARKQANDMLHDLLAGMGRTKDEREAHFIECGTGGGAAA